MSIPGLSIPGLTPGAAKPAGLLPGGPSSGAGAGFAALLGIAGREQASPSALGGAGQSPGSSLAQVRVFALQPNGTLEQVSYQTPFLSLAADSGQAEGLSALSGTAYTESSEPELPSLKALAIAQAIEEGRGVAILYPQEQEEATDELASLLEALDRQDAGERAEVIEIILGLDGKPLEVRRVGGELVDGALAEGGNSTGAPSGLVPSAPLPPELAPPDLVPPDLVDDETVSGGTNGVAGLLAALGGGTAAAGGAAGTAGDGSPAIPAPANTDATDAGSDILSASGANGREQSGGQPANPGGEGAATRPDATSDAARTGSIADAAQPSAARQSVPVQHGLPDAEAGQATATAEDGQPQSADAAAEGETQAAALRSAVANQAPVKPEQPAARPLSSLVDPALRAAGDEAANLEIDAEAAATASEGSGQKEAARAATAQQDNGERPQARHHGVSPAALVFAETVRGATGDDIGDETGDRLASSELFRIQPAAEGAGSRFAPQAAQQLPQAAQVAPQIALHIARHAAQGSSRFQIRLDPPELGRVDVELKITSDGAVKAHLTVERSETLDLFLRDQKGLERALDAAGLKVDQDALQFSLKDQGNSPSFADHEGQGGGGGKERDGTGPVESKAGEPDPELRRAYVRGAAGALDIQV